MKRILESGARHSAADRGLIQDIHDSAGFLGADCVGNKCEAARLHERGARHSAADMQAVQAIHDKAEGLGASCQGSASEADALRQQDSADGKRSLIQKALVAKLCSGYSSGYDAAWPWIRDVFDGQVVYNFGNKLYRCDYSVDGDTATVGDPTEVEVAYVPVAGDTTEALRAHLRGTADVLMRSAGLPKGDTAGKPTSKPNKESIAEEDGDWVVYDDDGEEVQRFDSREEAEEFCADNDIDDTEEAAAAAGASGLVELHESAAIPTQNLAGLCVPADIKLTEASVIKDGKVRIRVITPGWGSSGYYSEALLKRDGATAFPAGTQMFWNHQTAAEESARPEGNLDDLAAVTTSPAVWDASKKGLYADAKVFSDYANKIEEKGPFIGVSIRARGVANTGKAEGRTGPIVERLVAGKSIDYVTRAGARGGLELQESLRNSGGAADSRNHSGANAMTEQEQKDFQALRESAAAANDKVARLMERELVRQATAFAATEVAKSRLPEVAKRRLVKNLAINPPATADGSLDEAKFTATIDAAVKEETAFFAEALGSGEVRNLGAQPEVEVKEADLDKLFEAELGRMLPESKAKLAARGRAN